MKNFYALMTTQHYTLKEGTKTVYQLVDSEESKITEDQYKNIIDSSPFFRRLGGSEHHNKSYTCRGYTTWKLTSKSPDKQKKTVRIFDFESTL